MAHMLSSFDKESVSSPYVVVGIMDQQTPQAETDGEPRSLRSLLDKAEAFNHQDNNMDETSGKFYHMQSRYTDGQTAGESTPHDYDEYGFEQAADFIHKYSSL